jgi:hypothetical protein
MERMRFTDRNTTQSRYEPGQIWRYKTREGDEDSTLTVLKVETYPTIGTVVHVCVERVRLDNAPGPEDNISRIAHLPFGEGALDTSVTELIGTADPLPAFEEGYREWRHSFEVEEAGVFVIPVRQAVEFIDQALGQ